MICILSLNDAFILVYKVCLHHIAKLLNFSYEVGGAKLLSLCILSAKDKNE